MIDHFGLPVRWNIFARELEDILALRQLRLSHLDDRGIVLHREKVRRLQLSLKSPRHLTTLNPDEMQRLTVQLELSDNEQKLLHAALLATAVEMILMDRVNQEIAYMASNEVFKILFAAMQAQPDTVIATSVKAGAMLDEQNTYGDETFDAALDLIDRAVLAVHVSRNAASPQAQVDHALEAFNVFTMSLELLGQSQVPHHESEDWRYWYGEADDGRKMAEALMRAQGA